MVQQTVSLCTAAGKAMWPISEISDLPLCECAAHPLLLWVSRSLTILVSLTKPYFSHADLRSFSLVSKFKLMKSRFDGALGALSPYCARTRAAAEKGRDRRVDFAAARSMLPAEKDMVEGSETLTSVKDT